VNPEHHFPNKIPNSFPPDRVFDTDVSGAPGSRAITVTLKKQ
jgi:hypothetical protein